MYSDNQEALNKFYQFIRQKLDNAVVSLENMDTSVFKREMLQGLIKSNDVEKVVELRDFFLELDGSMVNDLDMLEFFCQNNAVTAPQVRSLLDSIFSNASVLKVANYQLNLSEKRQYEDDKKQCIAILSGSGYDFSHFLKFLNETSLSSKERIDILAKACYDSCAKNVVLEETVEKLEDEKIDFDINKYLDEFNLIAEQADSLINEFSYLIDKKDDKELNYLESFYQYYKKSNKENTGTTLREFAFSDVAMAVVVFGLKDDKEIIKSKTDAVLAGDTLDASLVDMLKTHLDSMKAKVDDGLFLKNAIKKQKDNATFNDKLFVYLLLDEDNKPFFDINDFDISDRTLVLSSIENLENGAYSGEVKHTKLLTKNKLDMDIFISKLDAMYSSFVKFGNCVFLLTFGKSDAIYSESENIVINNETTLGKINEAILNNNDDALHSYQFGLEYLKENLNNKGVSR